MVRHLSSLIALACGILLPLAAHAQVSALQGIINAIGGPAGLIITPVGSPVVCIPAAGVGACQLASMLVYAVHRAKTLVGGVALVVIMVAGFRLVISQSDDALTSAKRTVVAASVGLFIIFLTERLIDAIYGGFSIAPATVLDTPGNVQAGALIIADELMGILRAVEMMVAIVAIGLLIVQAVMVLGSFGSEDAIRKAYRAVYSTIFGILLIVFDRTIAAVFGYSTIGSLPGAASSSPIIVEAFGLLRFLLMLIGAALLGVVIYAGILLAVNYGNDELITRGKTTLMNAAIGLTLIVLSYAIVSTVVLSLV